jgi:hypothetical protein
MGYQQCRHSGFPIGRSAVNDNVATDISGARCGSGAADDPDGQAWADGYAAAATRAGTGRDCWNAGNIIAYMDQSIRTDRFAWVAWYFIRTIDNYTEVHSVPAFIRA